jgi:DNA invertase Pin-like site-specific DNA recombinase
MSRPTQPTAYSYVRFSTPKQAEGDSLRRQTEAATEWCRRNGAVLDKSTTLHDLGKSAYTGAHRQNSDRHALAAFLKLVEDGRVPRGSYLVIENLDRLSREHVQPALLLALNLLQAGIRIVQLKPAEVVFDERSDTLPIMMMLVELSRGHGESLMKSQRIGAKWREKKRAAAADKKPVSRLVPAWLSVRNGRFVVDEAKAAAVRYIFRLAVEGHGMTAIVKRLNAEGVPPLGRSDIWQKGYISRILGTRATVGEYQPHAGHRHREPDGLPIPDYYPAVISDDQWHAAQAALRSRRHKGGRPTSRLNLFVGLLHDARDSCGIYVRDKSPGKVPVVLVSFRAVMGAPGAKYVSFPLEVFERAILARLREIDPREILPGGMGAADRVLSLAGKLAGIEGRLEELRHQIVDGDENIPAVLATMRSLEAKRAKAAEDLAATQREASSPLASVWGDCRSLLDSLDGAPDPEDARVRLRSALRRIVDGIWCLFLAPGEYRLAAVQIHFTGGAHRDYLILHRWSKANQSGPCRPAQTWVRSFADAGLTADGLDLRKRAHAARLARVLESLDPADLGAGPG